MSMMRSKPWRSMDGCALSGVATELTDAVSFEAMRTHGVRTAFTLDRHFAKAGFGSRPRLIRRRSIDAPTYKLVRLTHAGMTGFAVATAKIAARPGTCGASGSRTTTTSRARRSESQRRKVLEKSSTFGRAVPYRSSPRERLFGGTERNVRSAIACEVFCRLLGS